jgi:sulfoxide reductase heme-binding subunit YedZ
MTLATATIGPSALWYLTRGTGATTLILMTVSVALGVVNVRRLTTPAVPRFVLDAVHRNASLLALAFLAVHIVTALLDSFAPINLIDAVIPFTSVYRPLWLGLGALASDLLIAVAITSVLRRRLGYGAWRATHWLAYASWPVAVLHGLGTGSDAKATWMLALTAGCIAVVLVAVAARLSAGWPDHLGTRLSAAAMAALIPVGLLVWLPSGQSAPAHRAHCCWGKRPPMRRAPVANRAPRRPRSPRRRPERSRKGRSTSASPRSTSRCRSPASS